jgi:molecular chaperone GrpE
MSKAKDEEVQQGEHPLHEEIQDAHRELGSEPETGDANESVQEAGAPESQENTAETTKAGDTDEYRDRYLRLYADFENFRKRTAKERIDMLSSASRDLMSSLLPVVDDFERALKALSDAGAEEPLMEGVRLIHHKMYDILTHKGLRSMEVAIGQAFDLERMEAITKIPAPTEELRGKVVDVLEQGYKMGEQVLRYARVVVGQD